MASSAFNNRPSYFAQYERVPFQSTGVLSNNITPISHMQDPQPSQQINILSPSNFNQYRGENQNSYSHNKPFAPPSKGSSYDSGKRYNFEGNPSYSDAQKGVAGYFETKKMPYGEGIRPNNGYSDINKGGYNDNLRGGYGDNSKEAGNTIPGVKKYAFEGNNNNGGGNYFNVDKYFQNFKDPFENVDVSASQKTIPKGSAPINPYRTPMPNHGEEKQFLSRVVFEQTRPQQPQSFQQQGQSLSSDYDQQQSQQERAPASYLPPSYNQQNEQQHQYQLPSQNEATQGNRYSNNNFNITPAPTFDLTIPLFDKKPQQEQYQQAQQPQQVKGDQVKPNAYEEIHPTQAGPQNPTQQQQKYEAWKKQRENETQPKVGDIAFQKQFARYLQEQQNPKGNILEQLEQRNNKYNNSIQFGDVKNLNQINAFKSQVVVAYDKNRTRMQSQQYLNKISNELQVEQVYFIKFLVEQLTIDSELDKIRELLLRSTEFSSQTIFNLFDRKKKGYVDFSSFIDTLETLSIPYIKVYIQKLFNRLLSHQDNSISQQNLKYCDFVEIFSQSNKPAVITQIFSFVGPKNGVSKEQKKSFSIIQQQSISLNEETHKLLHSIFTHLLSIEKSIQSFRDLQGEEEQLLKIFKEVDKAQKGYLTLQDFCDFLNEKGGDYQKEELVGIFRRLNYLTHSGRLNFNEFLLSLQREVQVVPPPEEQKVQNSQRQYPPEQNQKKKKEEEGEKPIKILKEPNMPGFKKVMFKGKQKKV